MAHNKQKNPPEFLLAKLLPNIVTLICLCVGLSAIRFAIEGEWIKATSLLLFAGFLDGVDGRLARFLNSTSELGAELDSLADFVNFGVVPGFILYMWINEYAEVKGFDWAMVLFFAIAMAMRLARFNVALGKEVKNPTLDKYFFRGVPAPCGAAMSMLPMVLSYEFGNDHFFTDPSIVISYIFVVAVFVSSTIPTISIKKIPIKNEYAYLTLIILSLIIVGLAITPWLTLAIIGITYAVSIPVTVFCYFKIKHSNPN